MCTTLLTLFVAFFALFVGNKSKQDKTEMHLDEEKEDERKEENIENKFKMCSRSRYILARLQ